MPLFVTSNKEKIWLCSLSSLVKIVANFDFDERRQYTVSNVSMEEGLLLLVRWKTICFIKTSYFPLSKIPLSIKRVTTILL